MIIRGLSVPLENYKRRRREARKLMRKEFGQAIPLLVCGSAFHDASTAVSPPAGALRQDAWFEYYCGCHEPGAVLLIAASGPDVLFLDAGDPERVVWEGARLAAGAMASSTFGLQTKDISKLQSVLEKNTAGAGNELAMLWRNKEPGFQTDAAFRWRKKLKGIKTRNAEPILVQQRMSKDMEEIAWHKKAVSITAQGLKQSLRKIPMMKTEAEVAASLVAAYIKPHYQAQAFAPIVGSGINGATLHYPHNDQPLQKKKPLLIDSGATAGGYCADVTRTLPQHGRFSDKRFREVYEIVLQCNTLTKKHAQPGITLAELNEIAWAPILDAGFTRHHGIGHHLGLDVHDPADYSLPLAENMLITNEPGVYLPEEGFGIRIEDDLLITGKGCIELTRTIPKTVQAIEKAMR